MKFAIITQVPHCRDEGGIWSYGPYVREIDLWNAHAHEVLLAAPQMDQRTDIDLPYANANVKWTPLPAMHLKGVGALLRSAIVFPVALYRIFKVMRQADHIHLRCPGNMGLAGCLIQAFFPRKPKTAKYAGNWDPAAPQPWSYRLQKKLLSTTWFARNLKVLVYGQWPGATANVVPFFTATYRDRDKAEFMPRDHTTCRIVFVGTLSDGKRPGYALELLQSLRSAGIPAELDYYGEGRCRTDLEATIESSALSECVRLHGARPENEVRTAYREAHFLVLASKSEGWPKAVAEAMFWGCIPLATPISCVPYMLDSGARGILLTLDLALDVRSVQDLWKSQNMESMARQALEWSQHYTLDRFEREIAKFMVP